MILAGPQLVLDARWNRGQRLGRASPGHTQGTVYFPLISAPLCLPLLKHSLFWLFGQIFPLERQVGSKQRAGGCWGHWRPRASIAGGSGDDVRFPLSLTPFLTAKIAFFSLKYTSSPWWQREEGFSGGDRTHPSHAGFSRGPLHT